MLDVDPSQLLDWLIELTILAGIIFSRTAPKNKKDPSEES
jgi:hypothetical protein